MKIGSTSRLARRTELTAIVVLWVVWCVVMVSFYPQLRESISLDLLRGMHCCCLPLALVFGALFLAASRLTWKEGRKRRPSILETESRLTLGGIVRGCVQLHRPDPHVPARFYLTYKLPAGGEAEPPILFRRIRSDSAWKDDSLSFTAYVPEKLAPSRKRKTRGAVWRVGLAYRTLAGRWCAQEFIIPHDKKTGARRRKPRPAREEPPPPEPAPSLTPPRRRPAHNPDDRPLLKRVLSKLGSHAVLVMAAGLIGSLVAGGHAFLVERVELGEAVMALFRGFYLVVWVASPGSGAHAVAKGIGGKIEPRLAGVVVGALIGIGFSYIVYHAMWVVTFPKAEGIPGFFSPFQLMSVWLGFGGAFRDEDRQDPE